jgi:alginate O-acetyltransferase complex protein AlgI
MTVFQLGILALLAVVIGRLKQGRQIVLLAVSLFVIYWLQPPQEFVSLIFWLPTGTIALTILVWLVVAPVEMRTWRVNAHAIITICAFILLIDLNQFFGLDEIYMTTTPRLWMIAAALIGYAVFLRGVAALPKVRWYLAGLVMVGIVIMLIYLKTPSLITGTFDFIHARRGQEPGMDVYALSWLGYSYVAFRLLHTLRDHQAGRLPALSLGEYVNYVIFFPSFTAGPIDRVERFIQELRMPLPLEDVDWIEAGRRFFVGLFKKFVIADALFFISINDVLVTQVNSPGWLWFFLYMYSFRIYFDFSGYTDIAIGLARVMGVRLPENFASPYLKPNLAQFWNSWHMTLTQWFRAYFFNPVTRSLRTRNLPTPIIIFITQVSTMILIGLWHGVIWNFLWWGIWHGLGLYIQNRWTDFMRSRLGDPPSVGRQRLLHVLGIFLTFNFVSLGWLFFTLSTPTLTLTTFARLFGIPR